MDAKLNWGKIAQGHLLKSQKYWNYKVLLDLTITIIAQLNSLFVLRWSCHCRLLINLLMNWVQYLNNFIKSLH